MINIIFLKNIMKNMSKNKFFYAQKIYCATKLLRKVGEFDRLTP